MAKARADEYSEDMNDYVPQYSDEEIEALMDNRRKIKNPYDTPEYAKGTGNIRTLDDQGHPTMGVIRGRDKNMDSWEQSPVGDGLFEKMRDEAKADFNVYDRELGEKVGEKGVETIKVSPDKKTIEKKKVYEKPLAGVPEKVMHPEDAKLEHRFGKALEGDPKSLEAYIKGIVPAKLKNPSQSKKLTGEALDKILEKWTK